MMKLLLSLSLFCCSVSLFADENPVVLEAAQAEYKGQTMILTGQVTIEHTVGIIRAEKLKMDTSASFKNLREANIEVEDQVSIALSEGGVLKCHRAELYSKDRSCHFEGEEAAHSYVEYSDAVEGKNKSSIPVVVKSRQMDIFMAEEEKPNKYALSRIEAKDEVELSYNQDFVITADRGVYTKAFTADPQQERKLFSGLIQLTAHIPESACQLSNKNGDRMTCRAIYVNTLQRYLDCFGPSGVLVMPSTQRVGFDEPLAFQADQLHWDDAADELTAYGHVVLQQGKHLLVENEDAVTLTQAKAKGERFLKTIAAQGKTKVQYTDPERGLSHTLKGDGETFIDHTTGLVTMDSLQPGEQLCFHDDFGLIYADHFIVEYAYADRCRPLRIVCEGNVAMLSYYGIAPPAHKNCKHYILADRVDYHPDEQKVHLSSSSSQRYVSFYDKLNHMHMTAPELSIFRSQDTGKEIVKGKGDVHFVFEEQETDKMLRQFVPLLNKIQ